LDSLVLTSFLKNNSGNYDAQRGTNDILLVLVDAIKEVAILMRAGELAGILGNADTENVQGEVQKKLDVVANKIFIKHLLREKKILALISEENEDPIFNSKSDDSGYVVYFDPLDGSSNIDVNGAVGSIFSIVKFSKKPTLKELLKPGKEQVLAGYSVYGPSTMLIFSSGDGVHGFTLDYESLNFCLSHERMLVPPETGEYAINTSNGRFWEPPIVQYVAECNRGVGGDRKKNFNMRWTGSMVADIHRILVRGGIFMYPKDNKVPLKEGRLRLLYEANPMSYLVEHAGGMSSTGRMRILDIVPRNFHQRIPLIIGSKIEVERIVWHHKNYDAGDGLKYNSPLFDSASFFSED
tara:strand:- start:31839 stop:32894 length:1056 start_codon:yes stop_codon:yes gene_type:complete